MLLNTAQLDNPGPTEYQDEIKYKNKVAGDKRPFGVNSGRFKRTDNGVPGAGTY